MNLLTASEFELPLLIHRRFPLKLNGVKYKLKTYTLIRFYGDKIFGATYLSYIEKNHFMEFILLDLGKYKMKVNISESYIFGMENMIQLNKIIKEPFKQSYERND